VKWRSIKVNVQFSLINSLRYLTFFSVRAVFGRPLPGFRSVADLRSSTRLQIAFTEQSFQPFSGNFATVVWYLKPSFCNVSIRALSSYDILPITKVIVVKFVLEVCVSVNLTYVKEIQHKAMHYCTVLCQTNDRNLVQKYSDTTET